ncbi:Methylenetetrahydrofolate reductase [Anthophora quadrimaculata]
MKTFVRGNEIHKKSINNNETNDIVNRSVDTQVKIDLRKELQNVMDTNTIFCSFELTRVKNNDFYQRKMDMYRPLFYALTWHMKNEVNNSSYLDTFKVLKNNTLVHLIANKLTRADVRIILTKALDYSIYNIFILRGDSTNISNDFPYAVDLVRFIRNQFGDIFCICVAGYPEMHVESPSKEMDLFYLKEKVKAGANFIITQIFFEANIFIKFVNDCKEIGIDVPIIPGIFPISNYTCLEKIVKLCKIKIPPIILNTLQSIKDNDDKVHNYGLELSIKIIKDIIASKTTCGFHLFTLNRTSLASEICNRLGIFH